MTFSPSRYCLLYSRSFLSCSLLPLSRSPGEIEEPESDRHWDGTCLIGHSWLGATRQPHLDYSFSLLGRVAFSSTLHFLFIIWLFPQCSKGGSSPLTAKIVEHLYSFLSLKQVFLSRV
jgi:hypothetical protein